MDASARLALPFLVPGQAQKEFFHNEALQLLDIIVQPAVEGAARNDPPSRVTRTLSLAGLKAAGGSARPSMGSRWRSREVASGPDIPVGSGASE